VLKPVYGSVPVEAVVLVVAAVVLVVAAVEPELTVPVEPVEDDDTVPDELLREELDPEELDPDEPEEPLEEPCEEPLPLPLLPLSGSTYCWSPAEGPVASAATGASSPIANTATSETSVIRRKVTPRVLQALKQTAFSTVSRHPHPGP
jgi:hypothetical protein